jgi:hypothetical protein
METPIKSSFIPQDAARMGASVRPQVATGLADIGMLLSIVLFVASITLAIGVFLYAQYLNASLDSKRTQLERAQKAFEPALVETLTRLDTRMNSASDILSRHTTPAILFALLEQLTLETVYFKNLRYEIGETGAATITMQGNAQSVNAIALQADLLAKHSAFSSPIFSNISREKNIVRFDLKSNVNPSSLNYANTLQQQGTFTQELPPPMGDPGAEAPSDDPFAP